MMDQFFCIFLPVSSKSSEHFFLPEKTQNLSCLFLSLSSYLESSYAHFLEMIFKRSAEYKKIIPTRIYIIHVAKYKENGLKKSFEA